MKQIDPEIWKALEEYSRISGRSFSYRERKKKIKKLFKL